MSVMRTWLLNIFFVVMLLWINASTITIQMHCNMADAVSMQCWSPSCRITSGCHMTPSGPSSNASYSQYDVVYPSCGLPVSCG